MSTVAASDAPRSNFQNRYIKVPDLATLIGVPTSTVYDLARQKRIGGMVRFGRHIRFDRDELERWLQAGGEKEIA